MKKDDTKNNGRVSTKDLAISQIVFSGKVKFRKLAKSTFIFTAAPALIITLFVLNGYIGFDEGVILFGLIFIMALLFNYPYIADLQEVTNYVSNLAQNKNPVQPDLSFLNNVEELSASINKLNESWQQKNDALKILLLEDEILINSLPNIVLMLDSELNFLQTNQAAKNIFGWNYAETIKKIISDERLKPLFRQVMESGQGTNIKYEFTDVYYYFFDIRIEKFPINSPNKIAIIIILQNLTQEKKTEKMLNDFVANASHEMKTPLASISGFIETLAEVDNDESAKKEFLRIMKEQSERMNRLINDLLVLSLAESGSHREKFENISLNDILQEALSNLRKLAEGRGVKIKTSTENALPAAFGDRDDIIRVFDNLISNAIKYSKENSEVEISLFTTINKDNKLKVFPTNQMLLCISVQDYGEGINEKHISRLTERFFRIDKARSRNLGGTGLGLSIVKQIVENHNGHLEIKSKLGQGSTFNVYLPAAGPSSKISEMVDK